MIHPLIARLSTESTAIFSFRLLRRQRVCFWMHSDVYFCFSSMSFSLSSASLSPVTALHALNSASPTIALPFSCLLHLSVTIVGILVGFFCFIVGLSFVYFSSSSPSSACHSFTSASHSQCQLVVLRISQESYKSGYRSWRYLTNLFLLYSVN